MEKTTVEAQHYKTKKPNLKMYYTTYTGPYNYLTKGFNKVQKNKN